MERAARLQALAKPEVEQRLTYLEQFRIEDAGLFNIGAARIAVLRSWGVETAAEIDEEKVGSIPGFGRNLTERLVNWAQLPIHSSHIGRVVLSAGILGAPMKIMLSVLMVLLPVVAIAQEGGYERDTIIADGPIIYGTGMNDADRAKAWKRFFMQMVDANVRQQGPDTLGIKLARRCPPGQDFCTQSVAANLVGIGGIQEPRRVLVMVATALHDEHQQVMRMVCTWPAENKRVCRDWDTGRLMPDKPQ